MSNINVYLDCTILPLDGYTAATASNGKVYYFRYSGGSDGSGNVTEYTDDGSGQGTITITLTGSPYSIENVSFGNDTHNDLSWQHGPAVNVAVITDTNIDNESAYYSVLARDPQGPCTFTCDPEIINKPKVPPSSSSN